MPNPRKVIVHIATSADGYIARTDGDLDWLTSRPAPKGFYGMNAFMKSIDTTLLGRKTYEVSLGMGASFDAKSRSFVFSRKPRPAKAPAGVEFVNEAIGPFVSRLRAQPGKDIWLMGGGEIIASFLDEQAIDEFVMRSDAAKPSWWTPGSTRSAGAEQAVKFFVAGPLPAPRTSSGCQCRTARAGGPDQ